MTSLGELHFRFPDLPAGSGGKFFSSASSVAVCVDSVCSARCWMLQSMDNMEICCVVYVKVGTFTHLEQSKISLLTVIKTGIVRLTIQHHLIVRVSFMHYPGDYLRQTSADVLSLQQCLIYSWRSCDFGCCTRQCLAVDTQTSSDRLIAHIRVVGNPCNLQLFAACVILCITNMLAATCSILTWVLLYIPQDFPLLFVIIFFSYSTPANGG